MTNPAPSAAPAPAPTPAPPAPAPAPAPLAPPTPTPPGDLAPTDDATKLKAALDKERELRKAAEKAASEGRTAAAKLAEIEAANQTENEKAVAAARKAGAAEVMAQVNARLVASEARALATAAGFRDASDAVRFLDLAEVKVSDDGTVDAAAITKALDVLKDDKPYLLVDQKPPVPSPGQAGIGVTGGAAVDVAPGMDRMRAAYNASPHGKRT